MILNGNQRGGARDLAIHLMKPENEHVDVHEIRGFVADTLAGALREAEAVSRGSRCRQFLYSLSLSPPEAENVPVAAFENAVDRIEEKLGLTGHSRVIVFHEKNGRRHAHCVWSRIDTATMTAVRMSHDRRKLTEISRELYLEHRWKMPDGLIDRELQNPLNFDRQEWFKAKRAGKDPRAIKAAFQHCWAASDLSKAFRQSIEQRGYYVAKGDRRGVVAVDFDGNVFAVSRWCGLREKDVAARFADMEALPSVDDVQKHVAGLVREKLSGFIRTATEEFSRVAESLEGRRLALTQQHRYARCDLQATQEARVIAEAKARAARFRRGIVGLWDQITGRYAKLLAENKREFADCLDRDTTETQALIEQQLRERQALQNETIDHRRLHARELARMHRALAEHWPPVEESATSEKHREASKDRRQGRIRALSL